MFQQRWANSALCTKATVACYIQIMLAPRLLARGWCAFHLLPQRCAIHARRGAPVVDICRRRLVCAALPRVASVVASTSHADPAAEPSAVHADFTADTPMSWAGRDLGCGQVAEEHMGKRLAVCGWVHRQRGLGGLVFCDIRTRREYCRCGLVPWLGNTAAQHNLTRSLKLLLISKLAASY